MTDPDKTLSDKSVHADSKAVGTSPIDPKAAAYPDKRILFYCPFPAVPLEYVQACPFLPRIDHNRRQLPEHLPAPALPLLSQDLPDIPSHPHPAL